MCFPGNDTGFPGLASDPTRPGPTPTSEPNFHILSPVRPPFGPTSHWRVLSRRVGRFHILSQISRNIRIKDWSNIRIPRILGVLIATYNL